MFKISQRPSVFSWPEACIINWLFFFTPIPCTYTSSPLDGNTKNYQLRGYAKARNISCLVLFLSYHLIPERKTIWTMLGSNPARQLRKGARYPLCHHLSGNINWLLQTTNVQKYSTWKETANARQATLRWHNRWIWMFKIFVFKISSINCPPRWTALLTLLL